MKDQYDVVVIGAGIAGLAVAYECAQQGKSVLVCEKDPSAKGASVRNFGMVWPIGQPAGTLRELALRSREKWFEITEEAGIWRQETGSLHLAYREDELAVLQEFVDRSPELNYRTEILSPEETLMRSPSIRSNCLLGSMWSRDEICVNPRQVVAELPSYLKNRYGVDFAFANPVTHLETGVAITAQGPIRAQEIFVCCGADFESLCPSIFPKHEIVRCKLQMLRARPKNPNFKIGPMLCAGLTLGHYANFGICDTLPAAVARLKSEFPLHDQWKIHVLVSQHANGELTIGDSHEYGNDPKPFNLEEIDQLILDYLDTFLPVDQLEIVERWHGVYPKCMTAPFVIEDFMDGVRAVVGLGGTGMTMSFGIAELATKPKLVAP